MACKSAYVFVSQLKLPNMGFLWNNETATFFNEHCNGTLIQTYTVHSYNIKLIICASGTYIKKFTYLLRYLCDMIMIMMNRDAHYFAW